MALNVAILGRPNVGKSTLFNRLVGQRAALVHDTPGVTRDWKTVRAEFGDLVLDFIDTAGLEEAGDKDLTGRMKEFTQKVLREKADLALFLIDARDGVTPTDKEIAKWIRPANVPVILVANKCESKASDAGVVEAYSLGFGDPIVVSAEHNIGIGELLTRLAEESEKIKKHKGKDHGEEAREDVLNLAVVGRPNAGKSTLINRLIGEERLLTGPEAGITRDSIAVDWNWKGRPIRFFDTAGLRKKAKIHKKLEKLSASDSIRAIDFANVVVLITDAEETLGLQDIKIASRVIDEGRALVIAVNKIDKVPDPRSFKREVLESTEARMPHARGVEVVFLSALTGEGVPKLLPAVFRAFETWNKRIPTSQLNRWLQDVLDIHPLPHVGGRAVKIRYISQINTRPPTFLLSTNRPDAMPKSYLRYLENELRMAFDLPGVPIRLIMKKGKNPFEKKKR